MIKMHSSTLIVSSLLLTFALTTPICQSASIHSDPVLSGTSSGTLVGSTVQLDNGALVHRFLGVPYALPPTGPQRRFELPEPIVNGSGDLLLAQQPKPTCMQMHHLSAAISPLLDVDQAHNVSEDCLYLNIYVPAGAQKSNLPIMVWLPGEGFDFADARQFNGAYLAALGQVIVVTVQYRVGVFGFLKGNNAAIWDQIAALRWINENAAALGGSADSVTLFGRFTGSMSISVLLSSPVTLQMEEKPLFSRAILMSGIAVGSWVFDQPEVNQVKAAQVLAHNNCADLACLKAASAEEVLAKGGYGWKPVVDGTLIAEEPLAALRRGHFPRYVRSVMLGSNQFEGNLCLLKHMVVDGQLYSRLISNNVTTGEYAAAIRDDLQMFYGGEVTEGGEKEAMLQLRDGGLVQDRSTYVQFCAELLINSHMRSYGSALNLLAKRSVQKGGADYSLSSVLRYKLDYKPSFSIAPAFINSSIHGDDVILAFGLAYKDSSAMAATEEDRAVSRQMVALFSRFAATGEAAPAEELTEDNYLEISGSSSSRLASIKSTTTTTSYLQITISSTQLVTLAVLSLALGLAAVFLVLVRLLLFSSSRRGERLVKSMLAGDLN